MTWFLLVFVKESLMEDGGICSWICICNSCLSLYCVCLFVFAEENLLESGSIWREVSCRELLRKSTQALSRVCGVFNIEAIIDNSAQPKMSTLKWLSFIVLVITFLMANFWESLLQPFWESGLLPSLLLLTSGPQSFSLSSSLEVFTSLWLSCGLDDIY